MNERLEEIKNRYVDSLLNDGYFNDTITITSKDYLWLIEQTERVEDLERQIYGSIQDYEGLYYSYQKAMSMMMRIEEQNKRYREALEFYANQSNWMNIEVPTMMDGEPEMVTREPLIFDDGGRKAREALGQMTCFDV